MYGINSFDFSNSEIVFALNNNDSSDLSNASNAAAVFLSGISISLTRYKFMIKDDIIFCHNHILQYVTIHPIPSHPIPSHPIPSHRIPSYRITSHSIPSHPTHPIPSHHITPHHTPSHRIISRIPSRPIASHRIPLHYILSHHNTSHRHILSRSKQKSSFRYFPESHLANGK